MTNIQELKKAKRTLDIESKDLEKRLSEISKRQRQLEKQIQDKCKHTKDYIVKDSIIDTLGKRRGCTYYTYCDNCGILLDRKDKWGW